MRLGRGFYAKATSVLNMTIPSPPAVAWRAIVLKALLTRGQAESVSRRQPSRAGYWSEVSRDLNDWLMRTGGSKYLTDAEKVALSMEFGTWTETECVAAVGRIEAVTALVWSLRLLPTMPSYKDWTAIDAVVGLVPMLRTVDSFAEAAALRPKEELELEQRTAEFWSWRARLEDAQRRGCVLDALGGYTDLVRRGAEYAATSGVARRIGDDAALGSKVFTDLSSTEVVSASSIAPQREYALNWLCGYSQLGRWDQTPAPIERSWMRI